MLHVSNCTRRNTQSSLPVTLLSKEKSLLSGITKKKYMHDMSSMQDIVKTMHANFPIVDA